MFTANDHSFIICAYKESPYLEECILSINKQLVKTQVKLVTSTPNRFIEDLAKKFNIDLTVNKKASGLSNDFNFAYSVATTKLVTIAHQDDGYFPEYAADLLKHFNKSQNPLIYFCDYMEKRNDKYIESNFILKIKRIMLAPLRVFPNSIFIRRRILSLANPICCPSVCFLKRKQEKYIFDPAFQNALDYDAWERFSKTQGGFLYSSKKLMFHRIHKESETTKTINNNIRSKEELVILERFWAKPFSNIIAWFYKKAQKSNSLKK